MEMKMRNAFDGKCLFTCDRIQASWSALLAVCSELSAAKTEFQTLPQSF